MTSANQLKDTLNLPIYLFFSTFARLRKGL